MQIYQSDINLQESQQCIYCSKGIMKNYWIYTDQHCINSEYHNQLRLNGWNKDSNYYRKFVFQQNCCFPIQIRIPVLPFKHQKKLRKICFQVIKLFKNEILLTKEMALEKKLMIIDQDNKQIQNNFIKKQSQKQGNTIQYQLEPIPEQIVLELKIELIKINQQLQNQYQKELNQQINSIIKQNQFIDFQDFQINLNIDTQQVKIFKSNNTKKGIYFTNYFLIIYGLNKIIFKKYQISLNLFVKSLYNLIQSYLDQNENMKYKWKFDKSGYLTINEQNQQEKLTNQKQYFNKNKQQFKQIKQSKQQINEPINLITNFISSKRFHVGTIEVYLVNQNLKLEEFKLFYKYSKHVHNTEVTEDDYQHFLCKTMLIEEIKQHQNQNYNLYLGSYHMHYRINGQLIAVGVVDITENIMNSAYFFYEPCLRKHNFALFGAMVELEYVKKMQQYFPTFQYYTLGYFVTSTDKMVYKAQIKGSEIQCPVTLRWLPLTKKLYHKIEKVSKEDPFSRNIKLSNEDVIEDLKYDENDIKELLKQNNIDVSDLEDEQKYQKLAKDMFQLFGKKLSFKIKIKH